MPEAIPPRQATELSTKEDVLRRATPMGGQHRVVQDLFAYARDTRREGRALSEDALVQERLLDAFIDCEIGRLFEERNERMKLAGQELTYETAQYTLWTKKSALRVAGFIHDVVGPFALLGGEDPCAPLGGVFGACWQQAVLELGRDGITAEEASAAMAHGLGFVWAENREGAWPSAAEYTGFSQAGAVAQAGAG